MADTSGLCRSLPGSSHNCPYRTICDDHPDRPATIRIQGETDSFGTDSFGAEYDDLCQECLDAHKRAVKEHENNLGTCDWCKAEDVKVCLQRDYEEGMCWQVYHVCSPCSKRYNERLNEEYEESCRYN